MTPMQTRPARWGSRACVTNRDIVLRVIPEPSKSLRGLPIDSIRSLRGALRPPQYPGVPRVTLGPPQRCPRGERKDVPMGTLGFPSHPCMSPLWSGHPAGERFDDPNCSPAYFPTTGFAHRAHNKLDLWNFMTILSLYTKWTLRHPSFSF